MSDQEFLELKGLLLEQRALLNILIPDNVPLSFICERSGKTRQAVRQYLNRNYQENIDFYTKKGRIYIAKKVAIELLYRSAKC